jgi:hypothetical protein
MRQGDMGTPRKGFSRVTRGLVKLAFADLGVLLLVILAHQALSADSLIPFAQVLMAGLFLFAVAGLASGISDSWKSYPSHRKVIIFLVAITMATLLAHAYIMGNPPAYTNQSATGEVGTLFNDSQINVNSTLSRGQLSVTLSTQVQYNSDGSVRCCTIADPIVGSPSMELNGSGFIGAPTLASPLKPGNSVTGTWVVGGSMTNLSVSYKLLDCYSQSSAEYGCIMDEVFYVPEGMGILAGQHCSTGAGAPTDCHLEHPPLVPALLAAGMAVFGEYNAVGWRVMPALLGTFSIPLLFGIAWKSSGSKKIAYLSATLLALDVLFFSQSSAGLLDIPEIFFGLAAFFVYFADLKVWKFDRYVLAGVFLGVAGLAKETAVFLALALLTYILLFGEEGRRLRVYDAFKVTLVVVLVFAAGLQAYDSTLATSQYSNFTHNVQYIFSYGSSLIANKLACQPTTGYWCKFPNDGGGPPILPTDWLLYYSPVAYFATSVCINPVNSSCLGGSYVDIAYYGVTNFLETWTVYVWIPLVAYTLYRFYRRKGPQLEDFGFSGPRPALQGEAKFAAFALTFFLWNYVPYLFLLVEGRVTYPFYIIPAVPAIAMGAAYWLSKPWFPRWLMWIYLVMTFAFFLVYFPDKAFLPQWLRILIGH